MTSVRGGESFDEIARISLMPITRRRAFVLAVGVVLFGGGRTDRASAGDCQPGDKLCPVGCVPGDATCCGPSAWCEAGRHCYQRSDGSYGCCRSPECGPGTPCGCGCCAPEEKCVDATCAACGRRPIADVDDLATCTQRLKKVGYKPSQNGCGPANMPAFAALLDRTYPFLRSSCNKHDRCYGTCNANRGSCDRTLGRQAAKACGRTFGGRDPLSLLARVNCYAFVAPVYEYAVSSHGDAAYADGQVAGCDCCV